VAYISSPERALAGRRVHVEVLGSKQQRVVDVSLEDQGEHGCTARHSFGPFAEAARHLGAECALLVVLTDEGPATGVGP
jgi:hypothetical protein